MALFMFGVTVSSWFGWLATGGVVPLFLTAAGLVGTLAAIWMEIKDV